MTAFAPTVVLLAAGLGSRFGGLKQLAPVGPGGAAILDYTLVDAARAGFARATVVVRPGIEDAVARHLARTGAGGLPWTLARQTPDAALPHGIEPPAGREKPWGTAHAVLAAAPALDGPFAVANGDDHYGPSAWRRLGQWLRNDGGSSRPAPAERQTVPRAALVGYRLADTLTEHGGVSRAVCAADDDGRLGRIAEATDVRREPDGSIRGTVDGTRRALDGDTRVSMNLWGFGPGVVPILERAFHDFVASSPGPETELPLPDVVGAAVADGAVEVRLIPSGGEWFGMTWPDDRADVARRLERRGRPEPAGRGTR